MSEPLEPIFEQLTSSGILSADDVRTLATDLSDKTPDAVAEHLVDKQLLTSYQARALLEGNTANLVLDDYLILDKLGEGGMGTVYKARHRSMDRLVALKVLPPCAMASDDSVKRFRREVQAAGKLTHPNIVASFDAGECNGVHYLVMEMVEGRNLGQVVKDDGPLPVRRALECLIEAARGLAHAHCLGIVHRDIKPSNLILVQGSELRAQEARGSGARRLSDLAPKTVVKILDMGLARFEASALPQKTATLPGSEMTQTGVLMGTVEFMAPEQALDPKLADARSDIYSLGCTFYYLLTGQTMYGGDTVMIKIIAHREDPIPSLAARRPELPAAVESMYRKMVAKKPAERFRDMVEVIRVAEWCLERESVASASKPARPKTPAEGEAKTELVEGIGDLSVLDKEEKELPQTPPPVPLLKPLVFGQRGPAREETPERAAAAERAEEERPVPVVVLPVAQDEKSYQRGRTLSRGANWLMSAGLLVLFSGLVNVLGIASRVDRFDPSFNLARVTFIALFSFGPTGFFMLVAARSVRRTGARWAVIVGMSASLLAIGLDVLWLAIYWGHESGLGFVGPGQWLQMFVVIATVFVCLFTAIEMLVLVRRRDTGQPIGDDASTHARHEGGVDAAPLLATGANWMRAAGILILLTCAFRIIASIVQLERRPRLGADPIAGVIFLLFALVIFFGLPAVFILVGAGQLQRGHSRGMVITGVVFLFCAMAFFGVWLLIEIISFTEVGRRDPSSSPVLELISMVLLVANMITCLTAALKTIITLGLPPVREAYGLSDDEYPPRRYREPRHGEPRYGDETDWERRRRRHD